MEFRASDELIGAPVGKFVTSTRWADKVEREVGRSSSALEQALGYGPGKLKDQEVLRIDLPFKPEYQPTFPNPSFQGANEKFIPGGFTSGGMPEIIVVRPPKTDILGGPRSIGIFNTQN